MTLMAGSAGSEQGSQASEQGGQQAAATQQPASWRDTLPEEFRNDQSISTFKDVGDLAKSYIHAQKLIGKDKVVLPSNSATAEEWSAFYQKLGMPEADKYAVEGLGDDEASVKLKELFVKNNILPNQGKEILNFLANEYSMDESEDTAAYQSAIQEGIEELKADWGESFEPNLQRAIAVVDTFGDDNLKSYLNETGLGDDPQLIRLFAKIGAQFNEDSFKGEPQGFISKQDAQARINAMYSDPNHPIMNSQDSRHKDALVEMEKLFGILNS